MPRRISYVPLAGEYHTLNNDESVLNKRLVIVQSCGIPALLAATWGYKRQLLLIDWRIYKGLRMQYADEGNECCRCIIISESCMG